MASLNSPEKKYILQLLDKTHQNDQLALTIFHKLFNELPVQIAEIKQAIDKGDYSLAEDITHTLHGSIRFCGFSDLFDCSQTLERALSHQDLEQIQPGFDSLQHKIQLFLRLEETITQYFEHKKSP